MQAQASYCSEITALLARCLARSWRSSARSKATFICRLGVSDRRLHLGYKQFPSNQIVFVGRNRGFDLCPFFDAAYDALMFGSGELWCS